MDAKGFRRPRPTSIAKIDEQYIVPPPTPLVASCPQARVALIILAVIAAAAFAIAVALRQTLSSSR